MERDSSFQLATQALLNPNGLRRVDTDKARPTAVLWDGDEFSLNNVRVHRRLIVFVCLSVKIEGHPIAIRINGLNRVEPMRKPLFWSGGRTRPMERLNSCSTYSTEDRLAVFTSEVEKARLASCEAITVLSHLTINPPILCIGEECSLVVMLDIGFVCEQKKLPKQP
jgi:hypothetical protein